MGDKLNTIFSTERHLSKVTTDQGGELGRSYYFINLIDKYGFILTTTGVYSSAQNDMAKKPDKDLAQIMCSFFFSAGLNCQFWSHALHHAVYLKN